ncbi:Tho complex subunit 7-domain-containing protein [Rhodofomes roseus]|uniref:Tho complex subunit 7-domain-containing protein n=1 Tax=Rhodofomes roseus TaxID=34475 RepID=A0ABQ8KYQ6_9APHY|nr:Tho complex subunit 7-domain-containing protein [Rhodofomes roseus]KAH9844336.1 Tho complex subunit 7-domain-containing protein [Rhodofomes roseus]
MSSTGDAAMNEASADEKPYTAPPMTVQQEDGIIHTRITNDEKALRRVTRKFHSYTSLAYTAGPDPTPATSTVDDAREAFLVELASFHLSLQKNLMVCEAEARQVEEYQRERERIASDHARLRSEIERLKTDLEDAQLQRKRKIEYDAIAEKINTLPSRDELQRTLEALENDMAAIRSEHEHQTHTIQAQKTALDSVIVDLNQLRVLGKQDPADVSRPSTPPPEITAPDEDVDMDGSASVRTREESGELKEDNFREMPDNDKESDDVPLAARLHLNPGARPFVPTRSRTSTPALQSAPSPAPPPPSTEDDDIEMGELAEEPKDLKARRKPREEELEEGEASDMSSELSDPPDD